MVQISIRRDSTDRFRKNKRKHLIIIIFVLVVSAVFFGAMFTFLKQVAKVPQEQSTQKTTTTPLPLLDIRTDGEIPNDTATPCVISYTQGSNTQAFAGTVNSFIDSSSSSKQHFLSLKLTEKTTLAGLPKADNYILKALDSDKSLKENEVKPDSRYLNVQLNGNNHGLFVLIHK